MNLLPCPNCSAKEPGAIHPYYDTPERVRFECDCGVSGPYEETLAEAMASWNNLPRQHLSGVSSHEVWHTTYYDPAAHWLVGDRVYYTEKENGVPVYLKSHTEATPIGIVITTPSEDAPILGFVLYPNAFVPKATLQEYNQ